MKKILPAGILLSCTLLNYSCGNKNPAPSADSVHKDSVAAVSTFYLEDLLAINDQQELEKKFGKAHVTYDTIWGAEGDFGMGTYIDKGTKDEVQITWRDSLPKGGVASASTNVQYDDDIEIFGSKWTSKTGVKLGMTSDELEKLNGRPFTFSGFGWNYGGGVTDWKGGKLDNQSLGAMLSEGQQTLSEKEEKEVLGDQDVFSNNPVVKKLQPKVAKIMVFHPGD